MPHMNQSIYTSLEVLGTRAVIVKTLRVNIVVCILQLAPKYEKRKKSKISSINPLNPIDLSENNNEVNNTSDDEAEEDEVTDENEVSPELMDEVLSETYVIETLNDEDEDGNTKTNFYTVDAFGFHCFAFIDYENDVFRKDFFTEEVSPVKVPSVHPEIENNLPSIDAKSLV